MYRNRNKLFHEKKITETLQQCQVFSAKITQQKD